MDENETVFVIEQGSYSNYHVVGIYTTREQAVEMVGYIAGRSELDEEARISEWKVNPGISEIRAGLCLFSLNMTKDGKSEYVEATDNVASYRIADAGRFHFFSRYISDSGPHRRLIEHVMSGSVWAKDEAHAVKIANEKRAQLIALDQWPSESQEP